MVTEYIPAVMSPTMKWKITKSFLLLTALVAHVLLPGDLLAGESSRGGTFLPMGWGAKGAGLGGAATILIRDDRSGYWNPANLTMLISPRVSIGTTKPVPELENWYSILSVGTGFMDFRTEPDDDVRMRRLGAALTVSHLGLDLAAGSRWSESTVGLSFALAPNHYNTLGFTCRIMKSWTDLDDADAWGTAFDVGWTALLRNRLWFSVVGRNVYSMISYPDRDEEVDPAWNLALAYERFMERISFECDAVLKYASLNRLLIGSEISILENMLYIVGGADVRLSEGERSIPSFGLGFTFFSTEVSLAFTFDPEDAFGRQTRVSISYTP